MTDAPEKNSRSAIKHPASTYRQVRQMIVPARDAMGAARPAPPERVAGNVSWEEKLRVCPGTSSGITKFSEHEAD
jgi:hypothetical protein